MADSFWANVLRSIAPDDHPKLILAAEGGLEIAVLALSRIEEDLVLVRGRVAGSADNSRLFILPFARILSVYVNRAVQEIEVDLYSPSVSEEDKAIVRERLKELREKAEKEAKQAEMSARDPKPNIDLKQQLEALRAQANMGVFTTKDSASAAPPPPAAKPALAPPPPAVPKPGINIPRGPRG